MNTERRTTETGGTDLGTATIALVALVTICLGAGVSRGVGGWLLVPIAASALAGVAAGVSLTLLQSSALARRALGSCGLVGALALLPPMIVQGGLLAVTASVATGATAIALAPGSSFRQPVAHAIRSSATSATVVVGIGLIVLSGGIGVSVAFLAGLFAVATSSPFAGFVSLQVMLLATVLFGTSALSALGPAVPGRLGAPSTGELLERATELPPVVHYVLGGQVLLWFFPWTAGVFESTLVALGPVGALVASALTSGVLHAPLGVGLGVAAVVWVGATLSPFGQLWLEPYPLRTLAFATGGALVALAALALVPTMALGTLTPIWALFGVFAAAFLTVGFLARVADARDWGDAWRHRALAVGAVGLFATTVVAALSGLAAPLVFVGVAASVFVWDVGENALSMRRDLGTGVDSRQTELVHAMGSGLVGLAGVAVATGALYGLGTVSPPTYRWQAVVPVALALAAVVSFAVVLLGTETTGSSRLRERFGGRRLVQSCRAALTNPIAIPVVVSLGIAVVMVATGGTEYAPLVFFLLVIGVPIGLLVWLERRADGSASDSTRNPPPRM